MGLITILIALTARLIFIPVTYSNYLSMSKNKRLSPDINNFTNKIKNLRKTENIVLAKKMENELAEFRKTHGLKNNITRNLMMLAQGFTMLVWMGMVHKFSFKLDEYPQMLTEGFFWFSDLTVPDPYFIFPILISLCIFSNQIKNTQITADFMSKNRSNMKFFPIIGIAGMSCLPMGLLLYIFTNSAFQAIFINAVQSKYMLKYTRDNVYIEGSRLQLLVSFYFYII
jgi:YidC/Oxa1 family membrane protein insertase